MVEALCDLYFQIVCQSGGFDNGDLVTAIENSTVCMTIIIVHTMLVNPQRHTNIVACWAWLVATQYHCRVLCYLIDRKVTLNSDNVCTHVMYNVQVTG